MRALGRDVVSLGPRFPRRLSHVLSLKWRRDGASRHAPEPRPSVDGAIPFLDEPFLLGVHQRKVLSIQMVVISPLKATLVSLF